MRTTIAIIIVITLMIASYFFGGRAMLAEHDLNLICATYTQYDVSTPEGAMQAALYIEKEIYSPDVKKAFQALAGTSVQERYQLYQDLAISLGLPNWQCKAMSKLD